MVRTDLSSQQTDWKTIVLAIVLMVTGTILVGGDSLGFLSLDRIQNYWPLAVIVVGLADLISEPAQRVPSREEHARQLWH